ncbi:hypothetical protein BJB15x_006520 [Bartonella sp. JB15]|nr:hypothetical protein BJB15x_006520 [Bartonella sp. JB15]
MLEKGNRSQVVRDSCSKHGPFISIQLVAQQPI